MTQPAFISLVLLALMTATLRGGGQPAYETESWRETRVLTWARPGESGKLSDAANWLERGQPATVVPDRETDIILPAADQVYRVSAANQEARHVIIEKNAMLLGGHRNEVQVWGNCHVKAGGRIYYCGIRGPGHTFFRIDDGHYPGDHNAPAYGHTQQGAKDIRNTTQISHKLSIIKYGDGSVELIGRFGVSDEIMLQHGRTIIGPGSELRWSGVTNKGALEIYDGAILELQSGATVGPFENRNGKHVYNIDVYRNGAIHAGSPARPLTSDAYLLLGFGDNTKPGATGLYAAAGSQMRVFSADPARARLVISAITSREGWANGAGKSMAAPEKAASGNVGVAMQLAGDIDLNGVHFDYICQQGIRLADAAQRDGWKNVTFGPHCAGEGAALFGPLTADANVYYHNRSDGETEYRLTAVAVKSMEQYMRDNDPYRIEVSPLSYEIRKEGKIENKRVSITFAQPIEVTVKTAIADAAIHYTTDGSEPTPQSPRYEKPIALDRTTRLNIKAFAPGRAPSATFSSSYVFGE
jgi:hypothetical protein